jgi:hypothetical protein
MSPKCIDQPLWTGYGRVADDLKPTSIDSTDRSGSMHLFVDIGQALATLFGFGGPSFHRSLKPQPERTHRPDWANADGSLGETLGLPSRVTWKKIHSSTEVSGSVISRRSLWRFCQSSALAVIREHTRRVTINLNRTEVSEVRLN